jgi:hypothetical protein
VEIEPSFYAASTTPIKQGTFSCKGRIRDESQDVEIGPSFYVTSTTPNGQGPLVVRDESQGVEIGPSFYVESTTPIKQGTFSCKGRITRCGNRT